MRYGPMALMGIAMWRESDLGTDKYDEKLRRNLIYYRDLLSDPQKLKLLPGYGAGPLVYALSRLSHRWPDDRFDESADAIIEFSLANYDFRYNEDALVLMGMGAHRDRLSDQQRQRMAEISTAIQATQDHKGLFRVKEHLQALRHQNQMYTIWGLAHGDMALGTKSSADSIKRCLDYTVAKRMLPDGALLWHHYRNWAHHLYSTYQSIFFGRVPERKRLFSCHQAFFIYAVQAYRDLTEDRTAFTEARDNALRWQYGQNVTGKNLFELNGIGVPTRIVLTSGATETPVDRWVGIYEIGAMIMCMVKLLEESTTAAVA
ncbi:MAG: hypothetical protein KDB27_25615 [Planctomycetales bacterium]|nr:hypothetical protein [Planctomycetales bacterium]